MTIAESVYRNYSPAGQGVGVFPLVEDAKVLEIGFGSGDLLRALRACNNQVYGTDVSERIVTKARKDGLNNVFLVDVSETPLPFADDFFDAVYCYEVFEHLTNPHRMFFEIRRVLKAGCFLFFSVPSQEISMGYGPSRHTFVYPGLLERHNLERFFMQMYFKIEEYRENADGIIEHRNYRLANKKQLRLPDVMEVIIGDYSVTTLYGALLDEHELEQEIERETEPYFVHLDNAAQSDNWPAFDDITDLVLQFYPDNCKLRIKIAEAALNVGNKSKTKQLLSDILLIKGISDTLSSEIKTTIAYL
ncbi:MAG: class I SAM-dependent methyltransferase [Desulfobulbus sp.]